MCKEAEKEMWWKIEDLKLAKPEIGTKLSTLIYLCNKLAPPPFKKVGWIAVDSFVTLN